jgi:ABC-2 type transport system ATP-binding protein
VSNGAVSAAMAPTTGPAAAPKETREHPRPVLWFDRVSKWYGPVIGVNQVSLELYPGITGLVGSNGAGKSTLMRLAAGQIRPELGAVRVCGQEAWSANAKRHVGYCPDVDRFYEDLSGRQFVLIMARLSGFGRREALARATEVLELVGMSGRCDRALRGYSKGMRQRIKLAQALVHDPQLLLLDEPLSGIDPIGRREFIEVLLQLAERGKCLLISSHELEELEKLTDRVAIVARGRIAAVGTQTQIRDLLDDHPLSVRLRSDRDRALALALLRLNDVVGIDLQGGDGVIVRARNPRHFFAQLTTLVLEEDFDMRHIETLDDSTHSLLEYLLK